MLLNNLGFDEYGGDDTVTILVGPNGSGKSNYLRDLATRYRRFRPVAVVCNTAYDRFVRLRLDYRMAVGRGELSAKNTIKRAMAAALDGRGSEFYQISETLTHCHYKPRLGFKPIYPLRRGKLGPHLPDEETLKELDERREDFERAFHFLNRLEPDEIVWIDAEDSVLEYSRNREFATVLRSEALLRDHRLLSRIEVFLDKDGERMELQHASSGELSLLSSLIFLICVVPENAIVLIDEPENSLHPSWQREYVNKLVAALGYRRATIVIATHAPLLVTGAIAHHGDRVSVYRVQGRAVEKLLIDHRAASPSSIEEILWKAFEVVTPANHFVSSEIVEAIGRYEQGLDTKETVLGLVADMEAKSFDGKQKQFFQAIRALVDKVEAAKTKPRGQAGADRPDE